MNYPKTLQFLYRASEHSFSSYSFHNKCDNIPNTLTIVRTEFGKTIAGFTKYTWNTAKDSWVNDADKQTFLLSLDLKEKMVPLSENNLIYCSSKYGPVFGGDLQIQDQCNSNYNSIARFPSKDYCQMRDVQEDKIIQLAVLIIIY